MRDDERDLSAIRDERRKEGKSFEKSYLFSLRSNLKIFLAKKISKKEENFFLREFLVEPNNNNLKEMSLKIRELTFFPFFSLLSSQNLIKTKK